MKTIGKVNANLPIYEFEWTISNFFSLLEDYDIIYKSPSFSFDGATWYLKIYPNGDINDDSFGYVDLELRRKSSGPPYRLEFSLSLKTLEGNKEEEWQKTCIFEAANGNQSHGVACFIARSKILERKSELLPSGALTVVCTLRSPKFTEDASKYLPFDKC